MKRSKPEPKNIDLANHIGISTCKVSDVLKESDKWLKIDPNSYQAKLKRPSVAQFTVIKETLICGVKRLLNST